MKNVYLAAAKRTPIGSFGGVLSSLSAIDLASEAIKALEFTDIDELFLGNVLSSNLGQAPAKQAGLKAGISSTVPSTTINKVCASGMKAAMLGAQSIQLGINKAVIASGTESMSNIPYYVDKARFGYKYGNGEFLDGLYMDGLRDAYNKEPMGCFGDATASKFAISREQQDTYAIRSYERAQKAWLEGKFTNEVIAVETKKGIVLEDEEFKRVNFDKIPQLKPVFGKDGTVTAANASTINDGAAAILLVSEEMLEKHGIKPLAKVVSFADAAHEPEWFTTAPVKAAKKALQNAGLQVSEIDYFEVNEAFSVVPMVFAKELEISEEKINLYGGAVSLGHPLGCSGARILCTLISVLRNEGMKTGMAAICNGGGGASAMILEKL